MGRLTTHVLDTSRGRPAAGVRVDLYRAGPNRERLASTATNEQGRCDEPLLDGAAFRRGEYELVFHAGAYFARLGTDTGSPGFLDRVVIRFGVSAPGEHYHVPLLLSPYGYSTYRGS
jgi:5-hydroxyisourate hydrolase